MAAFYPFFDQPSKSGHGRVGKTFLKSAYLKPFGTLRKPLEPFHNGGQTRAVGQNFLFLCEPFRTARLGKSFSNDPFRSAKKKEGPRQAFKQTEFMFKHFSLSSCLHVARPMANARLRLNPKPWPRARSWSFDGASQDLAPSNPRRSQSKR